jgi:predicted O-methyltransferase YrrM
VYEINGHKMLQYPGELEELILIFNNNAVKSYLEIGCKFGGSLWLVGRSLPKGSHIVAVDLMQDINIATRLQDVCADLSKSGYKVHLLRGDSTHPDMIRNVAKLGPFDACLIDGNHTLPYVKQDWENYGPMCKLVAFHDINYSRPSDHKNYKKYPIDVPAFWNGIKNDYRHLEIRKDKQDNGIGLLWR